VATYLVGYFRAQKPALQHATFPFPSRPSSPRPRLQMGKKARAQRALVAEESIPAGYRGSADTQLIIAAIKSLETAIKSQETAIKSQETAIKSLETSVTDGFNGVNHRIDRLITASQPAQLITQRPAQLAVQQRARCDAQASCTWDGKTNFARPKKQRKDRIVQKLSCFVQFEFLRRLRLLLCTSIWRRQSSAHFQESKTSKRT
jgi:hypothetical protein